MYAAWAEIAELVGTAFESEYPNLSGLVTQVESQEPCDQEWLVDAQDEARQLMADHALSDKALSLLEALVGR